MLLLDLLRTENLDRSLERSLQRIFALTLKSSLPPRPHPKDTLTDFKDKERDFHARSASAKRKKTLAQLAPSKAKRKSIATVPLNVTTIEVLQHSNASNESEVWKDILLLKPSAAASVDKGADQSTGLSDSELEGLEDPFLKIRNAMTVDNYIVDEAKFRTLDEQRDHYRVEMQRHAQHGNDEEEGWTLYSRTCEFYFSSPRCPR